MRIPYFPLSALVVIPIFIAAALWMSGRSDSGASVPPPVPGAVVFAELFTSEGCSSCPPADELLTRLTQQQPLAGVTILGLAEHVDYWNRLGWIDPFSSAANTDRQAQYAARLSNVAGGMYTPQLVIDGSAETVGSDASAVTRKIAQAAARPKAVLDVTALSSAPGSLQLRIALRQPLPVALQESSDIVVAVTEDNLVSNVRRGENSGRQLHHNSVLRGMHTAAALNAGAKEWSGKTAVTVLPEWKLADLKVIAFLQEHHTGRIVAVGWTQLAPAPAPTS